MLHAHPRRTVAALMVIVAVVVSAVALAISSRPPAAHASPELDVVYANGQTFYMLGAHLNTNPSPNLLAQSDELYVLAFPQKTVCTQNCPALNLPSGYHPQCDPCFHPGLPAPLAYHDHVLTGAPGFGNNGTAGSYKGPWQIIVLMYTPTYAYSPTFTPITSDEALDAAETAGDFLPINPGSANPYERPTGHVLICPLVSPNA